MTTFITWDCECGELNEDDVNLRHIALQKESFRLRLRDVEREMFKRRDLGRCCKCRALRDPAKLLYVMQDAMEELRGPWLEEQLEQRSLAHAEDVWRRRA